MKMHKNSNHPYINHVSDTSSDWSVQFFMKWSDKSKGLCRGCYVGVDENRSGLMLMCHGVIKRAITPVSLCCSSQSFGSVDEIWYCLGCWRQSLEVSNPISCEKNGTADNKKFLSQNEQTCGDCISWSIFALYTSGVALSQKLYKKTISIIHPKSIHSTN